MNNEFNIETAELEFKYSADDIKLQDFLTFTNALNPKKRLEVSGWDTYYSGPGLPFEFIRFRQGDSPELTVKIKTEDKNNNHRVEIDLPLKIGVSEWLISKFVNLFGFKENFKINKYCDIYWYENFSIVYYIIYNKNMNEVGRRIEIEANKDYPFEKAEEALQVIKDIEQKMSSIGIVPQKRMKKSMWEQFKKDI